MQEVVLLLFIAGILFLRLKGGARRNGSGPRKQTNFQPAAKATRPPSAAPKPEVVGPTPVVLRGAAYVVDGDSLVITKTQIRLFGVDAPELNHPYGKKAKWALHALCKGRKVSAEVVERDVHGRVVAKCHLEDGRDLSAEMVKLGLAIDWSKFSAGKYKSLEIEGVRKKLWLADARQKGHMHVWKKFDEKQKARRVKE